MIPQPKMNFDTHKYIKMLISNGFKEAQAESIVDVVIENRKHELSNLSTKDQIYEVKDQINDIKSDIRDLKDQVNGVKADVSVLKADVSVLKADVSVLKADVSVLKADVSDLKDQTNGVKSDIGDLKSDISSFKISTDSSFKLLEEKFTKKILEAKHDMIRWVIALIVGNFALAITIIVAFLLKS